MDKVQEMSSFVAVVENGSFVAAADITDLSKAAVSRHVANLERRLGIRLLRRTTRRLSLTPEGRQFLVRCKEVLAAIAEAESEVTSHNDVVVGMLRVNAPLCLGLRHLAPLWGKFIEQNPEVTLEVSLTGRCIDLIEEGHDVAICVGLPADAGMASRKLASTRPILCASPVYLQHASTPSHLYELTSHRTVSQTLGTRDEWHFIGPGGPVSVRVNACMHANDGETCRAVALSHQGIILQPDFLVAEDLRHGDLVELMPEYRSIELDIYAIYPSRKRLPLKIRQLVDFLEQEFREPPWFRRSAREMEAGQKNCNAGTGGPASSILQSIIDTFSENDCLANEYLSSAK